MHQLLSDCAVQAGTACVRPRSMTHGKASGGSGKGDKPAANVQVRCVSPDAACLAGAGSDKKLCIWDEFLGARVGWVRGLYAKQSPPPLPPLTPAPLCRWCSQ